MDFNVASALIRFGTPEALWLLVLPGLLAYAWVRQMKKHRRDVRTLAARREVPVPERFPYFGESMLWLFLILATASLIVALGRPQALVARVRTAGIDLVLLADASASMYVQDVRGSRWQRSTRFLAVLGDALRWQDDRIALALFAHIAAPQVRLTTDPNTFFFFLEHLSQQPPFRLEDDQTWDTNAELGIKWGLRLIDKDKELNGASRNVPIMVLVSDGQVWTGEVQKALEDARGRRIPVFVVGVGTTFGGLIPEPPPKPRPVWQVEAGHDHAEARTPQRSSLNRSSLRTIATAGGGQYFELDRLSDRVIAEQIIDAARRRAGSQRLEERWEELYWRCVVMAVGLVAVGLLTVRARPELWMTALAAVGTLGGLAYVLW